MIENTAAPVFVIRYRSPNDKNGNPRRVYVVYGSDGNFISAHDEGYTGDRCLPLEYRRLPCVDVHVPASTYRDFAKLFPR